MNTLKATHLDSFMFRKDGTRKVTGDTEGAKVMSARGIKNHRALYSMPAWMRDGFDSQEHFDLANWGESACRYYATDEGNPRAQRAQAALKLV